jgi:NADP-dependent 3-hydroxy acid dehydrogenase YdfG
MSNRKSIFITGAASGIGRETARLFANKGWYVGIVDMNEEGLKTLEAEIKEENCFAQVVDVTDAESVREVMDNFAEKTGGKMNALFNNAGILSFGLYADLDLDKKNRIVDVNLKGVMNCAHYAIPYLKTTPGARLINMASTSAIYGVPDLSVYSATKHAVCALTEAWDIELEKDGVVVSDILTPYVKTPLLDVPEDVYSIEKMGVKLAPSNIAQTVWKAVHGKKLHWWVGGATYALFGLFWLMPFIRRFVIKSLTIKPK